MGNNIYTHSYWQSRSSGSPVRLRNLATTAEVFELYNDSGFYVGWDGNRHFLVFYLSLISSMEHIGYLMTSSHDINSIFAVISSFYYNVEKCCTESTGTVYLLLSWIVFPHIPLPQIFSLVYVAMWFVGSYIWITPVWQVFYVEIYHGSYFILLMIPTSSFSYFMTTSSS